MTPLDRLRTLSVLADQWEETGTEPEALRANVVALAGEMGLTVTNYVIRFTGDPRGPVWSPVEKVDSLLHPLPSDALK